MASFPITLFRDDFTDGVIAPIWAGGYHSGSATIAESGGQLVATLPNATAGTHTAGYQTPLAWDLTGDGCAITIGTMVSTAVAASATFQIDGANLVQWYQQSNTINVQKVVAGVATSLYSAAWSASTYKYLRIRESGGTIFFDSSTNGTSWTNRASVANPFAITSVAINIGASCGNVASPGSFRVDDFNLILPTPSSTWRETTADWSITNRLRPITLAVTNNAQGVIVTADTMDSSRVLGGTVRYFAGPLGSSSGGYLALTEYASLVLAQASAFQIPVDGRVDLPAMVDARYARLYHRSTDASAHTLREFVPRRIVQADDIEAESIRAINISAGAVTADKIFVLSLAAVSAQMGALHMDGVIDIAAAGGVYQGSGTFASPTTGLKLFNSGGVGKLSGYNTGVEQITFDTDGKLKAGAGAVVLSAVGITIAAQSAMADLRAYTFKGASASVGGLYGSEDVGGNQIRVWAIGGAATTGTVMFQASTSATVTASIDSFIASGISTSRPFYAGVNSSGLVTTELDAQGANGTIYLRSPVQTSFGLNVGSASGAAAGDVKGSGLLNMTGAGTHILGGDLRLQGSGTARYLRLYNASANNETLIRDGGGSGVASLQIAPGGTLTLTVEASKLGFYGTGAGAKPTVSGSRGANAALASLLTALSGLGLLTDSST